MLRRVGSPLLGDVAAFGAVFVAIYGATRLLDSSAPSTAIFALVVVTTYVGARVAMPRLDRVGPAGPGRTPWPSRFWAGYSGMVVAVVVFELLR